MKNWWWDDQIPLTWARVGEALLLSLGGTVIAWAILALICLAVVK